jgi:hypothetical protein
VYCGVCAFSSGAESKVSNDYEEFLKYWEMKNILKISVGNSEGKRVVDDRIILKYTCMSLKIESSGGLF